MLTSINGDVGSGKTLLATKLSLHSSRPIYANYKINIDRYNPLTPKKLFQINNPSIIIIDEAYTWLESRLPGRKINLFTMYIVFQSRKRGLDFFLTEQLLKSIDVRYRLMTNYDIYASVIENKGFYYRIFKRGYDKPAKMVLPMEKAKKIFPLYDTYERIDPINKELLAQVTVDKSAIVDELDSICDELLLKHSAKSYTLGIVKNYCLRNDLPKSYAEMIYYALKAKGLEQESEAKKENSRKFILKNE